MGKNSLQYLIEQYASGEITTEELEQLKRLFTSEDENDQLHTEESILNWLETRDGTTRSYDREKWDKALQNVLNTDRKIAPVKSISALRSKVYLQITRYAAAVLLLIGLSAVIFYYLNKSEINSASTSAPTVFNDDILPGSDKAILKLGDGSKVFLDSLNQGVIAEQGNASVVKLNNGEIAYNQKGQQYAEKVLLNTMSTPRGGQYKLTLPDGTKVWLNAASSITYPTAFTEKERLVAVTGEVYMEVSHEPTKPFIVSVNNSINVRALGTGFNINAYPEEGHISTTLIEGKVQVSERNQQTTGSRVKDEVILIPGQQAVKSTGKEKKPIQRLTIKDKQVSQVLAWKNGYFDFENKSIIEMARQIERWYDVKFTFDGDFSDMELGGKMDRGVKLSDIIRFFNDYGFKTELVGRVITVKK